MKITKIEPKISDIGDFSVRRYLPSAVQRSIGPFIFFDAMGPVELPEGRGMDVRAHPHIGLATLTWLLDGEIIHRDSLGVVQTIRPGEVNWMTAGRGVAHSERSPDHARDNRSRVHGLQIWMALPADGQEMEPDFQHVGARDIPSHEPDGVVARIIAGAAWGKTSPVRVHLPTLYCDIEMEEGASIVLPDTFPERGLYVLEGRVTVTGQTYPDGAFLVLEGDETVRVDAGKACRFVFMSGNPLTTRRRMWWNFVALDRDRIERAKDDWRNGRFPPVPGEEDPLPLPE